MRLHPRRWLAGVRVLGSRAKELADRVFSIYFDRRIGGLAAESAFFALLSLPPIIFTLVGLIGFVAGRIDPSVVTWFTERALDIGRRFLTPDAINGVLAPTITDVVTTQRFGVVSVGFLIALWTGSRMVAVLMETITLTYGGQPRSFLRQRTLSILTFLLAVLAASIFLPLLLAGPTLIGSAFPPQLQFVAQWYWPVVGLGLLAVVTTLFQLVVPGRQGWLRHLPGAVVTVVLWAIGSQILRSALSFATGSASIYGPLSAPIAVMLWLYVMSLAILIGAAINAAIISIRQENSAQRLR